MICATTPIVQVPCIRCDYRSNTFHFLNRSDSVGLPLGDWWKTDTFIFAMLIIMYEMTMLAGVIATVIGIVFESRLPNMKPGVYDTRITEGGSGCSDI
ncbi:MAG: hypothetical protein Ct9H300mP19_18760 [Dehalococcoidia bacterium]|nr:MAG: hypothetical protein Ct9H300mP19_18760 [Dehalococcoidia bacterium]